MSTYSDPLELFNAAVAALQAADFRRVAELCDPASLRQFHRSLCQQYGPRRTEHVLTPEQYQQMNPDMPAEVVAYHVELHERDRRDPSALLRRDLPGVESFEVLLQMEPVAAFAAWLEGRSPQAQLQRAVADGHIPAEVAKQASEYAGYAPQYRALGTAFEGDRLAHVMYCDHDHDDVAEQSPDFATLSPEDQQFARDTWGRTHLNVATCRRQDDGTWRLLADHMFLSLGNIGFAYSIEASRDDSDESSSNETGGT